MNTQKIIFFCLLAFAVKSVFLQESSKQCPKVTTVKNLSAQDVNKNVKIIHLLNF